MLIFLSIPQYILFYRPLSIPQINQVSSVNNTENINNAGVALWNAGECSNGSASGGI